MTNKKKLRELALKATPGPYIKTGGYISESEGVKFFEQFNICTEYARPDDSVYNVTVAEVRMPFFDAPSLNPVTIDESHANAELHRILDPQTVIALLDELEEKDKELAEARELISTLNSKVKEANGYYSNW
jgi:hypothetical protein